MGFLPKRITKQNLDQVSVYIEDTTNTYFNVQEVPETITQGRYAFKIFGSDHLEEGVDLKMELLDSAGNSIFLTPVDFIGEEVPPYVPYRYVTVEVYSPPVNAPGLATLTILGQIRNNNPVILPNAFGQLPPKETLSRVPTEFQNAYNVRYQKTINVDLSTVINTQPIRFFKNPTTEYQEVVQAKTVLSAVSQSVVTSTSTGLTRSDLKGTIIEIESGSLEKEHLPKEISDTFKDLRRFKDEYKYKTGLRGKTPSIIKRRGLSTVFASKEEPKFKIISDSAIFKADMQGGTIEIPERTVTLTKTNPNDGRIVEETVTVPKFKTKILEVIDEKTIVPEEPPLVTLPTGSKPTGTDIQNVTIEDFSNTPITASFNVTNTTPTKSTVNFDSLLDLTIKDMRTFSGDIYRIRVHGKSEAAGSDFTVLTDTIVESPELLVDKNSSSGVLRTGYFLSQGHIRTYWNSSSFDGSTKGTNVSATHTGSHFIDSLHLSGSTAGFNQSVVVETKPLRAFTVRKNVAYTLTAKVKGQTTTKNVDPDGNVDTKGKLYFHLSGSNLNTSKVVSSHTYFGAELTDDATDEPVVLQLDEGLNGIQNFETIEHTFRPKFNLDRVVNTDTTLQIRAESGEWFISDMSLRPAMDTGFSPDEFDLKVPIPRSTRPDRFDFLVEYFDINNNVAETVTVVQDVPISGSALVIDGDGNLLTGSLFMGNVAGEGIEAAGVDSAFVRSVGYVGFQSASLSGEGGFMIWSGSVLPNSPDDYKGAGLEIHDGSTGASESYLRFRTNPSILDIHTSTFFLGKRHSAANFISGSNGNLQISSSNFELTADGDVSMSGEITATGGTIGGFGISSTKISTTGVELGNSTEDLFISSSAFKVDHDGNITASNIDLGGSISATSGDVGGWTIEAGALTAGTGDSAITMSSTDRIISMGSGSTFNKSDLQGGVRMGVDTDGVFKFAVGSAASYIHADATGVSIKSDSFDVTASVAEIDVDVFKLSSNNLFISSSGGGYIAAGASLPSGITGNNKGIYIQGNTGTFLAGNAAGGHLKFDGTNTSISASTFYLGNDSNYISGSQGNIKIFNTGETTISGSSVQIETPKFYLGQGSTQFVSGSEGNIEISSSMFHLDPKTSTLIISGSITANDGTIGGYTIDDHSISTTGVEINNSTQALFISSSNFKVTHTGQVTGSQVLFDGGTMGGWDITSSRINSPDGDMRLTSSNPKITIGTHTIGNGSGIQLGYDGSGVLTFFAGEGANDYFKYVAGTGISAKTDNFTLTTDGDITGSAVLFTGGKVGGWEITQHQMSAGNIRINATSGYIEAGGLANVNDISDASTGFFVDGDGAVLIKAGGANKNYMQFSGSVLDINTDKAHISGSEITLETPKFYLGQGSNFISGSEGNIEIFSAGTTTLSGSQVTIQTPKFYMGESSQYISGSNGNIEISSSGFHLDRDGNATMQGSVTATTGQIGGFAVTSNAISSSNNDLILKSSGHITGSEVLFSGGKIGGWNITSTNLTSEGAGIRLNANGDNSEISINTHVFGNEGIQLGYNSGDPRFYAGDGSSNYLRYDSNNGVDIKTKIATISGSSINLQTPKFYLGETSNYISGSNGNISIYNTGTTTLSGSQVTIETPKFFLGQIGSQFVSGSNGNIEISSSKFHLQPDGDVIMNNITASNANVSGKMTATTGEIGGFTIGDDLSNSAGSTLKLKGASGQITASAAKITGDITANTGTIGGWTVGSTLSATNILLDPSTPKITLGSKATLTDSNAGLYLGTDGIALGASSVFKVTSAGVLTSTSGTIGGWTLGSSTIVGSNLTLNSSGIIETNDFASNVKGFRLDSAGNGSAEFENVKIRGTLSTAVFEKETVNAVGGQLYVANSTSLTGSLNISASAATMSVVNVTGFTGSYSNDGEIIVAKKLTTTGFSTEYMLIQSASRDNASSDTDYSGKLYVVRGYRSGSAGDSSFLGDLSSISQSYAPGQIFASTGRIGTGYVRINANPNDSNTPYIDIVERTGSGVYDVDLKARLGDLGGLSTTRLHGTDPASAGFGLYSQNVFLEGGIVANTGSIAGIEMESGKLYTGTGTHGNSNTGFYIDSGSKFSLGDKFVWDGSDLTVEGSITITAGPSAAQLAALNSTTGSLETSVTSLGESTSSFESSITSLGEATSSLGSQITGAVDSGSAFALNAATSGSVYAGNAATSGSVYALNAVLSGSLYASGAFASSSIHSSSLASTITTVSSSTAGRIMTDISGSLLNIPASPAGEGLFLNYPHMGFYSGSAFTAFISASGGFLFKADDDNQISFGQSVSGGDGSTTKSFVLKSNNVFLSGSNVNILGERFFLGGGSQFVSGSNGNIEISSSKFHVQPDGDVIMNNITASNANLSGKVTSTTGEIGGWTIEDGQLSAGSGPSSVTMSATDQLIVMGSGSTFNKGDLEGGLRMGLDTDGTFKFAIGSAASYLVVDNEGVSIKSDSFDVTASVAEIDVDIFKLSATNLFVSSSDGGFIRMGSTLPTGVGGTNKGIYLQGSNNHFLAGNAAGGHISFDGTNTSISSSAFYLGSTSQYVSGSEGNIEISSSNFHLTADGDVTMSGDITATAGVIGGVTIEEGKIYVGTGTYNNSNTGFYLDSGGDFSLKDKFVWDSSESSLAVEGSITITGGPTATQLAELNTTTASLETSTTSLGSATASLETSVTSLGESTASFETSITAIGLTTASLNTATGSIQSSVTAVGASAIVSASAYGSGAVASGSLYATNAEATASLIGASAETSASAYGSGAVASGSLYATNAEATASLIGASAEASASAYGTGAAASASAVQTNLDTGLASVSSSVSGAFTTVSSSITSRIMTDISGSILDVPPSPAGEGLFLNYPHMGFYSGSAFTAFISASGGFLFKADSDNLISFGESNSGGDGASTTNFVLKATNTYLSGSTVNMLTDKFYLGNDSTFISGSQGNIKVSGSSIQLLTPSFYLGQSKQYISGSEGNIEISSSAFHLDPKTNTMVISGSVTATTISANTGSIGGLKIGNSEIVNTGGPGTGTTSTYLVTVDSSKFYINKQDGRGAIQQQVLFIEADNTYKFDQADDTNENHPIRFSTTSDGTHNSGTTYTTGVTTNGTPGNAGAYTQISVTHDTPAPLYYFCANHSGYGSTVNIDKIALAIKGSTGQITGSHVLFKGGKISGSNLEINVQNVTMSGSSVDIKTPKFYLGQSAQYISGSNGNIEISSSGFYLDRDGNATMQGAVTATTGEIGGATITSDKLAYSPYWAISSSNSTSDPASFISSSRFKVSAGGQITASSARIEGHLTIVAGPAKDTIDSINVTTGSLETSTTALGSATASFETSITAIGQTTASLNTATGSIQSSVTAVGASSVVSASAYGSGAVASGSLYATNAEATASLIGTSANASASAYGSGAVASGSLYATNAEATASLIGVSAEASASAYGTGAAASASAVQTNLDTAVTAVSGAFTSVSESITSRIMTDISGSILETAPAPFGEGLFLNYPHMGYYSGSAWNAYISASGGFLFKADDDNLISFGQSVTGGDGVSTKSFVLKSDNVYMSGSKIALLTDRFYLGSDSQYISGSEGNIEISSSAFHLSRDGNVTMSGSITANAGTLGGWDINNNTISSSGMSMDSSNRELIIGSASFGGTGVQLDYNSGTPRAHIGKKDAGFMKFDGTDVALSGSRIQVEADGDVRIGDRSDNYMKIDGSDGRVKLYRGGYVQNQFGANNVYIGRTDLSHVAIFSYGILNAGIIFRGSGSSDAGYTSIHPNSYKFGKRNYHHISGSINSGFFVKKGYDGYPNDGIILQVKNNLIATGQPGMNMSGSISASVIYSAGDVVAYNTSDERLKDNIRTIDKPIYKLKKLKGVEFEWNSLQNTYPSGSKDSGIIAQDVEKVLPQLVRERNNGYLGVRHDRLVGLLIEGIKEQQTQIDELKQEIEDIKNDSS